MSRTSVVSHQSAGSGYSSRCEMNINSQVKDLEFTPCSNHSFLCGHISVYVDADTFRTLLGQLVMFKSSNIT